MPSALGLADLLQQVAARVVRRMELGRAGRSPQVVVGQGGDGIALDAYLAVKVARAAAQVVARHLGAQLLDQVQQAWLVQHSADEEEARAPVGAGCAAVSNRSQQLGQQGLNSSRGIIWAASRTAKNSGRT